MRKTLIRTWRGNELPGGPCSNGTMGTVNVEGNASTKLVGGALVPTNRLDESTATIVADPDDG